MGHNSSRPRIRGPAFSSCSLSGRNNLSQLRPSVPDFSDPSDILDRNLAQIRTVDTEEEDSASTALSQYFSDAFFYNAIKPSFSENSVSKSRREDFPNFSCPFIQPFPPLDDLATNDK